MEGMISAWTHGAAPFSRWSGESRAAASQRTVWSPCSPAALVPRARRQRHARLRRPGGAVSSGRARGRAPGVSGSSRVVVSRTSALRRTAGRFRAAPVEAAATSAPDQATVLVELLHESVGEDSVDVDGLRKPAVLQKEIAQRDVAVAAHRTDAIRVGVVVLRRLDLRSEEHTSELQSQ